MWVRLNRLFENQEVGFLIEYADSILTVRRKKPLLKNSFVLTDTDIPRVKITLLTVGQKHQDQAERGLPVL